MPGQAGLPAGATPRSPAVRPAAPPTAARPTGRTFAINPATKVVPLANRGGYTVDHRRNDGSRVVISQRALPNGGAHVTAYRASQDPRAGTTTRTYADGHRVVEGRDFRSRALQGGPTYVTYRNGLRAASLPDGRPIYRDSFHVERRPDGLRHQMVQRTVYASYHRGRPFYMHSPLVRRYEVIPVHGVVTYVYRPPVYRPAFFGLFASAFANPIIPGPDCAVCPSPVVSYGQPLAAYSDPVELLGDMQISNAIEDGVPELQAGSQPVNPGDEAELGQLRSELSDLTQKLDAGAQADRELGNELSNQQVQVKGLQSQLATIGTQQAVSAKTPIKIAEDVRVQIRKQVRLNIAQHQNGHPLLLSDILQSGYASIYIFQASEPLAVNNLTTGEECMLRSGDLTRFSQVPGADSAKAAMKVIAAQPGSCPAGTIVEASPDDLQEMLNGFSQRVEANMQRLHDCTTPSRKCARL